MVARLTDTREKPADRDPIAPVSANNRSAVTNGSRLGIGIDGRTRQARRWRDVYTDLMARTGSRHEQLCRSLASLVLQREQLDADLARGETVDTDELIRVVGAISRLTTKIGIVADEPVPDATEEVVRHIRAAT